MTERPENKHEIDPNLVQYMRLAVAVTIIKTKPANQSAQLYIEQVCAQFRKAQLQWKIKVDELRAEVLSLKCQIQERIQYEAAIEQIQTEGIAFHDDCHPYPTPPCSAEDVSDRMLGQAGRQNVLAHHLKFLKSVLALSTVSVHELNDIDIKEHEVMVESALITLGDVLTTPAPGMSAVSKVMLSNMTQTLLNLVDNNGRLPSDFSGIVYDKVLCFVWGVTAAMLVSRNLEEDAHDCLSYTVVSLSRSCTLRPAIINILVKQLNQVAEHLRAVCLASSPLNECLFKNSYHIFHSLEQVLEADILRQDQCLSAEFCCYVFSALDDCLLHVWDRFQLFAQYVWHIQSLIQYLHTNLVNI